LSLLDTLRRNSSTFRRTLTIVPAVAMSGCGLVAHTPVFDPKGPVALAERDLLLIATEVMLIVIIPVFVLTFWFAWRYRASNTEARYMPEWSYSAPIDAVIWLVPALIVALLGYLVWTSTHRLDPYRQVASEIAPLEVDVVAQDWKWLFLYPEQKIATVNELVFPSGRPLRLKLTSDTVMNSFYVPGLGGQIYAMAGMQTRLHLLADEPGRFVGRNTQYSGGGFPDQQFEAIAASRADFDAWVAKVRQSQDTLDGAAYEELAKPSERHPVTYYATFEPGLFDRIIAKYAHGGMHRAPNNE
jgi:cytochrome o ubiquinol oxidase subunit II